MAFQFSRREEDGMSENVSPWSRSIVDEFRANEQESDYHGFASTRLEPIGQYPWSFRSLSADERFSLRSRMRLPSANR